MPTRDTQTPNNLALTLTAGPVFGRVLTLAECATVMERISLEFVVTRLVFFKHLNEEVFYSSSDSLAGRKKHTLGVVRALLPKADLLRNAMEDVKGDDTFRPLSNQAVLAALELALRCSPRDAAHPLDKERTLELTHVLLSFQSALFSDGFTAKTNEVTSYEALGAEFQAEFIRNVLANNVRIDTRSAIGRFYAFTRVAAVKGLVKRRTKQTADAWFRKTFGLTSTQYLMCAFLSGSPGKRMDPDNLKAWTPAHQPSHWAGLRQPHRTRIEALLELATQDIGEPTGAPKGTLNEFLYAAHKFHVYPLLRFGRNTVCVSPEMLLRKFLFGLPYLALAATERRLGRKLTDSDVKGCREAIGYLFEGYVQWLVKRLLAPCKGVETMCNVPYGPKGKRTEIDLVIQCGEVAIVIELKAVVASLGFRMTGKFEELDKMLEKGATQAFHAARAVREGKARRRNGAMIKGVRWAVPCVLTYDEVPLFQPIGEFYERHLAKKTGLPLFVKEDGIEAVQFFDIRFVESWENTVNLSPVSRVLCGCLINRAREAGLRYQPVDEKHVDGPARGAPRPFDELIEQSRKFLVPLGRTWLKPSVRSSDRKKAD